MTRIDMTEFGETTIPAGAGLAFDIEAGEVFDIVALEGPQVADMWAFARPGLREFLSTEHTRSCLDRLSPSIGDAFFSNRRRAILTIIADSSPGTHDLLLSACDQARYWRLGHKGPHRSCVDNLREALDHLGIVPPEIPSPVNIFENVAIGPDGSLEIRPPKVEPGQAISLRAETDLVLVISACPMDIVPTNGSDLRPKPLAFRRWRTVSPGK